jgi:hypothetical protein
MDENTKAIVASRLVVAIAIERRRYVPDVKDVKTHEGFAISAVNEFQRVYELLGASPPDTGNQS